MRQSKLFVCFGVGLVGASLLVGCRNSSRHCACDYVIQPVAVLPSTPVDDIKTAAHLPPPKKDNVLITAVAPGVSQSGSVAGTVEITGDEAEALGIKPGYTPGALYSSAQPGPSPVVVIPSAGPTVIERRSDSE